MEKEQLRTEGSPKVGEEPSVTLGRTEDGGEGGLCRTCCGPSHSAKPIFAEDDSGMLLFEVINDLYKLKVYPNDGLPEYICSTCHQSVLAFQEFKKTSHEGHNALTSIKKKLAKDKVKTMDGLCRLCANQSYLYRNIFHRKHRGVHFYEMINELCCLNVYVGDNLPAWVCHRCHNKVIKFDEYKRFARRYRSAVSSPKVVTSQFLILRRVSEAPRCGVDGELPSSSRVVQGPRGGEGRVEVDDEDMQWQMADAGMSIESFLETQLEEGE